MADLSKLFENVPEHPEPYKAKVTGTIPKWVKGTLLRNGPGIFKIGEDKYNHLFDGLAIVQRHYIENGQVEYSTKYVRSAAYERNMKAQRIVVSEFGTMGFPDPCKTIFQRYFSYFFPTDFTDNDLVHFVQCGDEVYASTETGRVARIDTKTVDTLEKVDMGKYIAVNTVTAHAHYDSEKNTLNMGSRFGKNGTYNIIFVPKPAADESNAFQKSKILASIPAKSAYMSYYHSFGMSQNFVIFPEMPLLMNPWKMITSNLTRIPFSHGMEWWPKIETKFHILDVKTGEKLPINFTADPFFTFHHINAFESDNCVFMDAVIYMDGAVINSLSLDQFRKGEFAPATDEKQKGLFRRFVFPKNIPEDCKVGKNMLANLGIKSKASAILRPDGSVHCTFETLFDNSFELPIINYDFNGKKYRYCYGAALPEDNKNDYLGTKKETLRAQRLCDLYRIQILKFDILQSQVLEWNRDHEHQFASEPIFVSRPGSTEEDDGVLLVAVTNIREKENNFLVVLDSKNLVELGRAEIEPHVPVGFHGIYLPEN